MGGTTYPNLTGFLLHHMDSPKYRLRTFGPVSLESDGQPISGLASQRKRLALLALLAAAGDLEVARDKILAYLWPESDSERARNTLYQLMHVLRRELGDVIVPTNGDLKLNLNLVASDVVEFRTSIAQRDFARATELYRGPFLDGLYLRDAPEFEHWMETERADLAAVYAEALERLATAAAAAGDRAASVRLWRTRATVDPLSARVARAYMEALVAAGDREAAMQYAQVHFALVRSELGAEPDSALEGYVGDLTTRAAVKTPAPPLEKLPADRLGAAMELSETSLQQRAPDVSPPSAPFAPATLRVRWGFRHGMLATVLLITVVLVAVSFAAHPRARPDLVIVTPFENQTGDTSLNILGLVIANSLTQGLAATGHLSVGDFQTVLRTMPRRQAGDQLDPARASDVVRESGAGWVVRGGVRRRGDSLVVDVRIIRGPDGNLIAALDPIIVPRNDEERLLERARQTVVGAMAALHDASLEAWGSLPGNLPQYSAQQEYTLGLDALTRADVELAHRHFRSAVQLDARFSAPRFELLWSRDALSDSMLKALNAVRDRLSQLEQMQLEIFNASARNDLEAAYQWAERRVALTPDDPAALLLLASFAYNTNRFTRSIAALHSVRRFPAWRAGYYILSINAHHMAGDIETALREAREGRTRDPRNWMYCSKVMEQYAAFDRVREADSVVASCQGVPTAGADPGRPFLLMGQELLAHGHVAEAERVFARCIALRVDFAARHPDGSGGRARMASQCHFQRGDWTHAYPLLRRDFANYTDQGKGHMELGIAAAHVGDTATALAMLRWHEHQPPRDYDHLWYRAGILLALDRRDDAVQLLRQAVNGGSPAIMTHINNVRAFLPLAGDSRFEVLVAARR